MPIASVQFFDVVVFLHIAAVVLAFGPTFSYAFFLAVAEGNHPRAVPAIMDGILRIDRTLVTFGSLVILASGIYLATDDARGFEMSDFFVNWGLVAILILLGLTHAFFRPRVTKLRELAVRDLGQSGDGTLSDEYLAESKLLAKVGTLTGLLVLLTIYVMAAKPFA